MPKTFEINCNFLTVILLKFRYIILACDGLWKSFSNEDSVQLVDEIVKKQFEVRDLSNDLRNHF